MCGPFAFGHSLFSSRIPRNGGWRLESQLGHKTEVTLVICSCKPNRRAHIVKPRGRIAGGYLVVGGGVSDGFRCV